MTSIAPSTARSGAPLGAAWLLTALAVGLPGYLLYALSEQSADRTTGLVLGVAGLVAAVTGAAAVAVGEAVRLWSLALSGAFVVLGGTTAAVLLSDEPVFSSDVLLLSVPAVVGGVVTAALALRHR